MLTFIAAPIDWYRQLPTNAGNGPEPVQELNASPDLELLPVQLLTLVAARLNPEFNKDFSSLAAYCALQSSTGVLLTNLALGYLRTDDPEAAERSARQAMRALRRRLSLVAQAAAKAPE